MTSIFPEDPQERIDVLFLVVSSISVSCSLIILFLHSLLHQTTISYANKLVYIMTVCNFFRSFFELVFLVAVRENNNKNKAFICFSGSLLIFCFRLAGVFWGVVISYCVYSSVVLDNDVEGRHKQYLLFGFGLPLLFLAAPLLHEDVNDSTFCSLMGVGKVEFPSGLLFTFFEYILFFWVCNIISICFYCKVLSFVRTYFRNSIEEKRIHQKMAAKIMIFPGGNMIFGILICIAITYIYVSTQERFNMRVLLIIADHMEAILSAYVYGLNDNVCDFIKRKFRVICCLKRKKRPKFNDDNDNSWHIRENLLSDEYESNPSDGSPGNDRIISPKARGNNKAILH